MTPEVEPRWKVGELARATGVTVRALHHYDELGLLVPSERSQAGHRLYDQDDVRRLYRIVALRRLSLPLEEIGAVLEDKRVTLADTVRRHLDRVELDLERQERLRARLREILSTLDQHGEPSENGEPSADQFIDALEVMAMVETTLADVVVPFISDADMEGSGRIPSDGQPVMLLKEQKGERVLAIFIGHPEGNALALELAGVELPRPLTQDFMVRLVEAAGGRVERVCISRFGRQHLPRVGCRRRRWRLPRSGRASQRRPEPRCQSRRSRLRRRGRDGPVGGTYLRGRPRKADCVWGPHRDKPYEPEPTEWRSLQTLIGTRAAWESR